MRKVNCKWVCMEWDLSWNVCPFIFAWLLIKVAGELMKWNVLSFSPLILTFASSYYTATLFLLSFSKPLILLSFSLTSFFLSLLSNQSHHSCHEIFLFLSSYLSQFSSFTPITFIFSPNKFSNSKKKNTPHCNRKI